MSSGYSEVPDSNASSLPGSPRAGGARQGGIDIWDGHGPLENIWREVARMDTAGRRQPLRNKSPLEAGLWPVPYLVHAETYSLHDQN